MFLNGNTFLIFFIVYLQLFTVGRDELKIEVDSFEENNMAKMTDVHIAFATTTTFRESSPVVNWSSNINELNIGKYLLQFCFTNRFERDFYSLL